MNPPDSTLYACYRRPDPVTGEIHPPAPREPQGPSSTIGLIEYTRDPALFFHAEKYRGISESARLAILGADSPSAAQGVLDAHPLEDGQRARWHRVRDRVLLCAAWIASTQHPKRALAFSRDQFDGLDVQAAMRHVQERLEKPNRLVITGSPTTMARAPGYALIDWFVQNRDLAASGHGVGGTVDEVLSGNANGGDSIGEEWAMRSYIPVSHFPARDGGLAGNGSRYEAMGRIGTHLLAFHLGGSNGTAHMIDIFVRAKKPYWRFSDADVTAMSRKLAEQLSG